MRTFFLAIQLAAVAILAAGCDQAQDSAKPANDLGAAIAKAAPVTGGDGAATDNQTLEQMLDRTMNRFARLDLNGDGKLTQDELNAATEGGDATANEQRPRTGLSARAFENADTNGDGVITRQEVEAQTRARFKALDANADGKVSQDELASGREGGKARPAQ